MQENVIVPAFILVDCCICTVGIFSYTKLFCITLV